MNPNLITRPIGSIPMLAEAVTAAGQGRVALIETPEQRVAVVQAFDRSLLWFDLCTTERTLLRFCWEACHRAACPLPLHPPT